MRWHPTKLLLLVAATAPLPAQQDPDRDRDGLSDFQEVHKYLTDPDNADSDGDGVPDGDWLERREYQYTVRSVVQVMRPVTIEYLNDDHQDARILDETDEYVELEVIHYPFTTVAKSIPADPDWRRTAAAMEEWTRPGPTSDWTPAMRLKLLAALRNDGIDALALDDKTLVEQASRWLCQHTSSGGSFLGFVTAFDEQGRPFVPERLLAITDHTAASLERDFARSISARGMFEHAVRGSCTSSAIYLNGCMRALGIPTRTILTIPIIDANDDRELQMLERGITHHGLRQTLLPALQRLRGSWASHTFNEVFVGGRWRRLNYSRLGQDIADPGLFGLITHIATFGDWAEAHMPETVGWRQTKHITADVFGFRNPYSTIALRDAFGPHCTLENPVPDPVASEATVADAQWGDSDALPADIRGWFAKRDVFGLAARVEGLASFDDLKRFLGQADPRITLTSPGQSDLSVGFNAGAFWWLGDHAWVVVPFGGDDRKAHVASARYALSCRNDSSDATWIVDQGVAVPPRQ